MQFNSHASNQDIVSEINSLCDSDATSYPINDKTRRVNSALEELVALIINADGSWQYDDTNYTDVPIGTGTLVEAQESYSFASEYLEIEMVKVKDVNGRWHTLDPIDIKDFRTIPIEEYFSATGMPTHYDKQGDTIRLYPAPTSENVTLASGIKVHFQRTADLFTTSDTTQKPGLPSPYHILLAYMSAIPYCMVYHPDRVALYEKRVDDGKKSLIKFYSHRNKDKRKILKIKGIQFR